MSDVMTIDINHIYRDSKFSQFELFSWKIVFICNECKLEKNFFCIDLSKYRLITSFWNSLPMIFKRSSFGCCIVLCPMTFLIYIVFQTLWLHDIFCGLIITTVHWDCTTTMISLVTVDNEFQIFVNQNDITQSVNVFGWWGSTRVTNLIALTV